MLTQMVRFQLGENLAAIAEGGGLANTVFKLIEWAESQGRLAELVTGALKANPGNPGLRACAAQLGLLATAPTPGPTSTPVSKDKPPEIFYSYAPSDKSLRDKLETHLKLLQRQGVITGWHDGKVEAGQDENAEILSRLESADVILLLISADFIASDVCYSVQMERAMERQSAGNALVIPILLRPCDWKDAPFSKLKALPSNDTAVTRWGDRDEAFTDIARGIRSAVERWRSRR
ncbi:Hypothetical protein AA314_09907 [Archangium gephyra]|uniref:TIR domain-containing protein n=1 Tax=Archangium gephyra TaxID=48 RepID=A0AAC8TKJ1_9BACT|nr:Hypothetical protein AA314_09907 [Archangium gephyra]